MSRRKPDATRLRELIARACLSQQAFARRIGRAPRAVRYWVAGARPVPIEVMLAAEHLALCESTRAEREEREGWTRERLARQESRK